jgi:hypothetical protein
MAIMKSDPQPCRARRYQPSGMVVVENCRLVQASLADGL